MTTLIELRYETSVSPYTTLNVGGNAQALVEVTHLEQLLATLAWAKSQAIPHFVIGRGSNLLWQDSFYEGIIIVNRMEGIIEKEPGIFEVESGHSFMKLGVQTARLGWTGLEFAAGIPGTVGGAIFMNAGANGQLTSDTLTEVTTSDPFGNLHIYKREELSFGYRFSPFQLKDEIILRAQFNLTRCQKAIERQQKWLEERRNTQPYRAKSAGCIFQNPLGLSAGRLIEQTPGLKGKKIGGAEVSTKHCNFIINANQATAKDIADLIRLIQENVYKEKGVLLNCEIKSSFSLDLYGNL